MTRFAALLMDIHIGVKNDSAVMREFQFKFFENILIPELKKRDIKTVIQAGDVFDRRKYVNFETLYLWKRRVFDMFKKEGINLVCDIGNHDVYHKNTNRVNSPDLLLKEYDNIKIIETPTEMVVGNKKILIVPWITADNHDEIINTLKTSDANIVIGHFEIAGAMMCEGVRMETGLSQDLFKRFEAVYSGHFHLKSTLNNIKYLGTPYEMTWHDYGDQKGFYILDGQDGSLEYIKNPMTFHEKIIYNDEREEFVQYFKTVDYNYFANKSVKLFVEKKTNLKMFETFVENLYKQPTCDFTIMEDMNAFHESNIEIKHAHTSTKDLINMYIDDVQTDMDKKMLKNIMNGLYMNALMEND